MNTKSGLGKNGTAYAAFLSAMLGCLALALVNLGTEISEAFRVRVHSLGKFWMPGAEGIGPYSGKETIALLVWLATWVILHLLGLKREWNYRFVITVFMAGMGLATILVWPPVFSFLAHH